MATYQEIQGYSFLEASARSRANNLVDEGTFTELLPPVERITSPHLPVLKEAVSFDDGVVTGVGKIGSRPVFVISQEGKFIGGAVGEVHGAKIISMFKLAQESYQKVVDKYPGDYELRTPAIIFSFETGGVRLHEANAGLLAHAEIMEQIQACRGKVPVISVVGSKVGCFGGMGFVAIATDCVIMSPLGRIGLTGPEVIEEAMGKKEFDASNKGLIYRITGGKHKYIMGDAAYLVEGTIGSFRQQLIEVLKLPYEKISAHRVIGSLDLVQKQLKLVELSVDLNPKDATDVWEYYGNKSGSELSDMFYDDFMKNVKIRPRR